MTALVWDPLEERFYETGIERGVLYPVGGTPAVWNGLVSVAESPGRESKVYYHDGLRILERLIAPGYSAKLSAFTYPEALEALLGNQQLAPGVSLHDQRVGQFHLAYRTRIGNPLQGSDYAYKLHLVYNLIVNPGDITHQTISDDPSQIATFDFTITGMQTLWGTQPVNHISFDSRTIDPTRLAEIEAGLYGTDTTNPAMPDLAGLLGSF